MKIVLLANLLISGKRYCAGDEVEVEDGVAIHLIKEELAAVGVTQLDEDVNEEAEEVDEVEEEAEEVVEEEAGEVETVATPEDAFAPIPEAEDEAEAEQEPEPEEKPVKPRSRRSTKKVQ